MKWAAKLKFSAARQACICSWRPDGRCECELLTAAETAGVRVYPTSGYWMPRHQTDPCGRCVLVGFSSIEPELIPEGVHRLAQAWFPEK